MLFNSCNQCLLAHVVIAKKQNFNVSSLIFGFFFGIQFHKNIIFIIETHYTCSDHTPLKLFYCLSSNFIPLLPFVLRKLLVHKIHPEVLSQWCRRNEIQFVVRDSIKYDISINDALSDDSLDNDFSESN